MSMPARIAWYRNTAWIAWRTGSLPRNENETLETPPEMWLSGKRRLSSRAASMKATRVVVVLLDAGGDREHVRVEDDVLGREADLLGQQLVGARADLDLALDGVGLAVLVERHHHHGGAVAAHQPRLAQELGLAFLHRDRVDDALALQALQPGLDHAPLGAVDHHRDAGDVGLGGDQVEVVDHRLLGVEHALVHVDVEDLRAALDLLARDHDRLVEAVFQDQLLELRAAGDVGALADVDEVGLRA